MTDPTIEGAVLCEDDLPEQYRDPYQLQQNLKNGERSLARIPSRYRDAVVTVPAVAEWVRGIVRAAAAQRSYVPSIHKGPSLLLIGGTGSGKTFEAYGAIRAFTVSGASCSWQFITAADLYAQLRPRHRVDPEEELEKYLRAGLLVLDDIGAAKSTEWTEEINYRLINHRYERELTTLITSNVPPKNLPAVLGERVASRLVEMTDRVVLAGSDRRMTAKGSAA